MYECVNPVAPCIPKTAENTVNNQVEDVCPTVVFYPRQRLCTGNNGDTASRWKNRPYRRRKKECEAASDSHCTPQQDESTLKVLELLIGQTLNVVVTSIASAARWKQKRWKAGAMTVCL